MKVESSPPSADMGNSRTSGSFSGGKEEPGETPEDALVREIREELDTEISVDRNVTTVEGTTLAFTSICVAICVA